MKIHLKSILGGLALAGALIGNAQATLLSTLLDGGSITAGDKRFDNWTVLNYVATDGRQFDASKIDVAALDDGGMNPGPGLRFSVLDGAMSIQGDDLYAFVDLMFGFRAMVLTPGLAISGNTLNYAPGGAYHSHLIDDSYDVGSYIRETIGTAAGLDDLGLMDIEFSALKNPGDAASSTAKINDSATFSAQSSIWVTKNLFVWAQDSTDSAGIFGFEQRFSQTTIPEPGTLLLAGVAALALGLSRRHRA